jgi:dTDP-4-dehydrorhamnose 3,5-epimerase
MLDGVRVRKLRILKDERGHFVEAMRSDWRDLVGEDRVVQANLSTSYPGIIRAWHRHERGQVDYFLVLKGSLRVCAYDEGSQELDEIICHEKEPQIVRIPGEYWHGYMVLGDEVATVVYFTTKLYDYDDPDEGRRPWDNTDIVPVTINGAKSDTRVGKPWDWLSKRDERR